MNPAIQYVYELFTISSKNQNLQKKINSENNQTFVEKKMINEIMTEKELI